MSGESPENPAGGGPRPRPRCTAAAAGPSAQEHVSHPRPRSRRALTLALTLPACRASAVFACTPRAPADRRWRSQSFRISGARDTPRRLCTGATSFRQTAGPSASNTPRPKWLRFVCSRHRERERADSRLAALNAPPLVPGPQRRRKRTILIHSSSSGLDYKGTRWIVADFV